MKSNHTGRIPAVKFNVQDRREFIQVLRTRVNAYFKDNNISRYANLNMKVKTAFMISLYFIPLALLAFGAISQVWVMFLLWALMGLGMAGIGLSIMHDANHGSYSRNQKVNDALGYLINFIGGYHINWKIQHNVLHHSFTNIHEHDEDLENSVLRFSPNQERKWIYRFQAFYAPVFYAIMTLYWSTSKDFQQVMRYHRKNLLATQGLTLRQALGELTFNKAWYILLTMVMPMLMLPFSWWIPLLGFVMMHLICGLSLALIFQTAHVIEETNFFKADESGSVENNWAVHQLLTTANFANGSRVFSWFIGGLNYQIEHHLFPNICHVHYRKISKIVRETAQEYGIPYYEHRTFVGALRSHFKLLYQLGTGKYDKQLATVPVQTK